MVDLHINQGADWFEAVNFVRDDQSPINLSGYTFLSAFRTSRYTANVSGNLTMSIVNAQAGNTILSMNAATSANINAGNYFYDVFMIDYTNTTTKILEGILTVSPGVTIT